MHKTPNPPSHLPQMAGDAKQPRASHPSVGNCSCLHIACTAELTDCTPLVHHQSFLPSISSRPPSYLSFNLACVLSVGKDPEDPSMLASEITGRGSGHNIELSISQRLAHPHWPRTHRSFAPSSIPYTPAKEKKTACHEKVARNKQTKLCGVTSAPRPAMRPWRGKLNHVAKR